MKNGGVRMNAAFFFVYGYAKMRQPYEMGSSNQKQLPSPSLLSTP